MPKEMMAMDGGWEKKPDKSPQDLFTEEIRNLAAKEADDKRSAHFSTEPQFNPALLADEDRRVWERVKSGNFTKEDIDGYAQSVRNWLKTEADEARRKTRMAFMGFIANRAMPAIMLRGLSEDARRELSGQESEEMERNRGGENR
ncbi:MAG: hypothetical protein KGI73_04530 [Patescibacteria group bacterium]|nr:hypothetical protein [Patescibacteria group bacterium]